MTCEAFLDRLYDDDVRAAQCGRGPVPTDMAGHMFAFFIIAVAAAEVAVGLAIVLSYYRLKATVYTDEADLLRH